MDLAGYLARIAYGGTTDPTLDTLHGLVAAHNRSIPFENLDPLTGVPVVDLGPAALTDKLVHRRRGGYCYEHNGLMGFVLEALGYGVERFAGRVVWMSEPGAPLPAQTHHVLAVTVPGDGRTVPGRRRVRRADPVVAAPAGGRPDPADPPRAVPVGRRGR